MGAQSDMRIAAAESYPVKYKEFGYAVGQLIKFSILYDHLNDETVIFVKR